MGNGIKISVNFFSVIQTRRTMGNGTSCNTTACSRPAEQTSISQNQNQAQHQWSQDQNQWNQVRDQDRDQWRQTRRQIRRQGWDQDQDQNGYMMVNRDQTITVRFMDGRMINLRPDYQGRLFLNQANEPSLIYLTTDNQGRIIAHGNQNGSIALRSDNNGRYWININRNGRMWLPTQEQ
ncbi:hypothetical protein BH23THE1_BH23THE1_35550 [soil metagenome]